MYHWSISDQPNNKVVILIQSLRYCLAASLPFFTKGRLTKQKPVPAFLPGQDQFLRCHLAWRFHARSHVHPYADHLYVGSIRLTYSVSCLTFLLALRSPFDLSSSVAIPPSAALWVTSGKVYSLFVIGLLFSFLSCLVALRCSSYNSHSSAHLHDLRSFRQAPTRQSLSEGSEPRHFFSMAVF